MFTLEKEALTRLLGVQLAPELIIPRATWNRSSKPMTFVEYSEKCTIQLCTCMYVRTRKTFMSTDSTAIDCVGRNRIAKYTRGAVVLTSELYPSKESVRKYLLYVCYAPPLDPTRTKKSNEIEKKTWTYAGMCPGIYWYVCNTFSSVSVYIGYVLKRKAVES